MDSAGTVCKNTEDVCMRAYLGTYSMLIDVLITTKSFSAPSPPQICQFGVRGKLLIPDSVLLEESYLLARSLTQTGIFYRFVLISCRKLENALASELGNYIVQFSSDHNFVQQILKYDNNSKEEKMTVYSGNPCDCIRNIVNNNL